MTVRKQRTMPGEQWECDVLVIGTGAAGCRAAIEAAEYGARVLLTAKGAFGRSGTTNLAGVVYAAALGFADSRDTPMVHFKDTIKEGRFLGHQDLAWLLANEAPRTVYDLERYGLPWYKTPDGLFWQQPTPGHRYDRGCHYNQTTGKQVQKALVKEVQRVGHRIQVRDDLVMTALLHQDGRVVGATALDLKKGQFVVISARSTVLATGGAGQMFRITDLDTGATGDGTAMAMRAGADVIDPEFHQFFPTAFVYPESLRGIAVATSALWKYGLRLYNGLDERFMERYNPGALENATRDVLSRAIFMEIMAGRGTEHGGVWLDTRFIENWDEIRKHRARSYEWPKRFGVDTTRFEIAPTYHFTLGGVMINENAETTLPGLFAAGEVAGGIHGANRIGGNALVECMVFGQIAGRNAAMQSRRPTLSPCPEQVQQEMDRLARFTPGRPAGPRRPCHLWDSLGEAMYRHAGLVRTADGLRQALQQVQALKEELAGLHTLDQQIYNTELLEALQVEAMLTMAEPTLLAALRRTESRGAHYRSDYPESDPAWLQNQVVRLRDGQLQFDLRPVALSRVTEAEVDTD